MKRESDVVVDDMISPDVPPQFESPQSVTKFFTISNLLSISRALLAFPFTIVMLSSVPSARTWGAAIMCLAALTDKLDGVLARKYGQITEWGKILDPLADKIGVAAVALVLVYLNDIPLWFVVGLGARDVLILVGGIQLKSRRGIVLPSNEVGKWAVGVVSLALFTALIGIQSVILDVLIWASVVMLGLSLYLYVRRFVDVIRQGA